MKLLIVMAAALGLSLQAQAAEYLVKYKNKQALNQIQTMGSLGISAMRVTGSHEVGSWVKVDVLPSQEVNVLASLASNEDIEWVTPNFKVKAFSAPVEASALKSQWAIQKVNAEAAWKRAGNRGSRNVLVAVIDTGVDYKHKNLVPNMVAGYDFKEKDNDPMDKTSYQNPGHGTHCAGIIGATGLVDDGIIGISPEVSIMPLRFLGEDGSGNLDDGIKAIDYAIEKGAQVISASWGATVPRSQAQALVEAVKRADDKGLIFVVAAANDGKNNDVTEVYPANAGFPNTIAVAASGNSDAKPSWSNYGTATVHLAAPGENIMSTLPKDKYGDLSGTSMATPLVSGLVAFLKSQDSSLTGSQVRALLQTTGAQVSIQTACNCRVDALSAVDAVLSKKMWVYPAAGTLKQNETMSLGVMNGKAPFKFESSDSSAVSVDANGTITGLVEGKKAIIKVTDASGAVASSLDFNVGKASGGGNNPQPPGGEDPTDPGQPGECPIGDPALCQIICQIKPDLPFCK